MKIASNIVPTLPTAAPVQETPAVSSAASAAPAAAERQSAVLEAAKAALREMPEIDEAKVAQLREALARGEVQFDAQKLARLISRYHGGRE